jgi:hypothetical protein
MHIRISKSTGFASIKTTLCVIDGLLAAAAHDDDPLVDLTGPGTLVIGQ